MTYEKKKNYFIFFAGLIGTFPLRVVGVIYAIELLALASYLFIPWMKCLQNHRMAKVIKMGFLWLVGAMIADFWNHTETMDMVKGWFNIVLFIAIMPFAYWALIDNPKRWIWYVAGNGISSLLSFYIVRGVEMEIGAYEIWQVYAWGPFVLGLSGVIYYRGKHKLAMLLYLAWGVYAVYNGSRNMFLTVSLAVVIMYMVENLSMYNVSQQISQFRTKLIPVFIYLTVGALLVDSIYENLASSGALGDAAYEKYMTQKAGGNMLKGGRFETFLGAEIAMQNPIIGYGSFARYKSSLNFSGDLNRKLNDYYFGTTYDGLPGHSHIIGYWVSHGCLGFLFWAFILYTMWKLFKTGAFLYEPKLVGHCLYFSLAVMWAIIFSPFGQRTPMAFYIVYLIVIESHFRVTKNNQLYI